MTLEKDIDKNRLPEHIAIIMDGNGRWAKKQGLLRVSGHRSGTQSVREVVKACRSLGVGYLTLYAFSQQNWNRPKDEVDALMHILMSQLKEELLSFIQNGIKVKVIGRMQDLPIGAREVLEQCIEATKYNTSLTLILALSYGSQTEIEDCIKCIATKVLDGDIKIKDINSSIIEQHLYTQNIPSVDLLIRTSGEMRLSNFLLWQIAYAELYFTPTLWPDFSGDHLLEAIKEFQSRERRFGKTSEQLQD